jgi:murein DD-endopeptidase MepM/ murein hydrolase activator NlpD
MMSAAPGAYRAPVAGSVVVLRPFTPPRVRYGPGHLGVDLRVRAGDAALAAGSGVVRFAGVVAGRGVVVVAHPDGLLTEYEPVEPALPAGTHVESGSVLGRVRGVHRGCVPAGECLHWGARRGGTYLDPLTLLLPLGQVRLVPWGAST